MQSSHWISWKIDTKAANMPSQDVWKFTPVSYRTSALWGRCPALTPLLQLITTSRASGTADHVQSLDDLFLLQVRTFLLITHTIFFKHFYFFKVYEKIMNAWNLLLIQFQSCSLWNGNWIKKDFKAKYIAKTSPKWVSMERESMLLNVQHQQ